MAQLMWSSHRSMSRRIYVLAEQVEDAPRPARQRNLGMPEGVLDHEWDVGDAPSPAARLHVLRRQRAPVGARADGVAVDGNEQRNGAEAVTVGEVALPVEAAVLGDCIGRPVPDLVDQLQRGRVTAEAHQLLRKHAAPHLQLGQHRREQAQQQRRVPDVVVEIRDRLVQLGVAVRIGQVHVGQVGEVLGMHAEVGVEVGDQDPGGVQAALAHQQPIQVAATPGHGARLADHDAGLERVEDVDEVGEGGAELLAQGADIGDPGVIGLAGDDRADLALGRPLGLGQCADRLAQLLERLGVGRDERKVGVVVPGRKGVVRR